MTIAATVRKSLPCVLLLISLVAHAQNAQLTGSVTDISRASITNASVAIENTITHVKWLTKTNHSGIYVEPSLDPGVYRVSVSAPTFETEMVDRLKADVGGKLTLNFILHPETQVQSVTVDGSGVQINQTDASVSTVVDREFVSNIPLNGRSFQSLLSSVPGVTQVVNRRGGTAGEFSVNGQGTVSNYYTVDGVAANTGAAPSGIGNGGGFSGVSANETVLGTTQSLLSIDAMQEFRTTTSSYSAEYGRTPGGQFSFASRAGANEVHGTAFDYLCNAALDANNTFNKLNHVARQTEHQNDFGGTFGGPVWIPHLYDGHNRTFFFFSYEGLRLTTPVAAALTGVPSLALRQDPRVTGALKQVLNSFPVPNAGTDVGNGLATFTAGYTSPSHVDSSSLRFDHSFNEHFKIFGRAAYAPSSIATQDKGDMAILDSSLGMTRLITLGATNILSASSTNNLRFNLTANNQDTAQTLSNFGGATPFSFSDLPGFADPARDNFQFALTYSIKAQMDVAPVSTRQRQINVVDTFTRLIGRHTLHFGVDYRRLLTDASRPPLYEYAYASSAAEIYNNSLDGIEAQKYVGSMRPINTNYSFYAQDEWKATQRLNLSFGLRWEIDPAPQDASGNNPFAVTTNNPLTAQLAPQGTRLWQTQYGNLAPRFGLAYQAHQTAGYETVVRLGGGVFYDVPPSNAAQGYGGVGSSATIIPTSVSFPLPQNVLDAIAAPNSSAPYSASVYGLDPHLSLPYTLQWNAALEQGLGKSQSLTITYVAALGRRLYQQKEYQPYYLGNTSFGPSATLFLFRNTVSSDYNALQVQFNRKMARGLQLLGSYTWAHGIDDANTNAAVYQNLWSVSDNDIRNNAQASLTYEIPGHYSSGVVSAILAHWSLATRVTARSALPIDLVGYQAVAIGRAFNWSARLELCQWIRETLDKESVWDVGRSTSLSR